MSAEPDEASEIRARQRAEHERAVEAHRRLNDALENESVLEYALRTRNDPEILEGMTYVAEHLESGEPFKDARPMVEWIREQRADRDLP
jgi:hypothetical protein